jgi:hypothetical protein
MRQILACLLLATLGRTASGGACAVPEAVAVVLTPPNADLDDAGGVVVAIGPRKDAGDTKVDDLAKLAWHFQGDKPAVNVIGPGLAVVSAPHHGSTLEDAKGNAKLHVRWRHAKPKLEAPRVKSLVFHEEQTPRGGSSSITLALDAPPPPDAVAVMVFSVDNPLAKPQWSRISDPKATTLALDARGRCAWVIPGNAMPGNGAAVSLAWLDSSGRVSAMSKPVTITQK